MKISRFMQFFVQFVFDAKINASSSGVFGRIKEKIFTKLYNLILKFGNPLVTYHILGFPFLLPLSHRLASCFKSYPQYSLNLARIAEYVKQKYDNLALIDIGANIGDSIPFLRKEVEFPILCIEGDEDSFNILKKNITLFSGIETVKAYLGENTEDVEATLVREGGTSSLDSSIKQQSIIQIKKLADILKDKQSFLHSKMIKIDTDGFDCKILKGALDFLATVKPIVFFEYDPFLLSKQGNDGISIFNELYGIGYRNLLIYDNFGDYVLSTSLDNLSLLEEIHLYFSGRMGHRYCDICIFHNEDTDLFEQTKDLEIKYFKQLRCGH